MRAAGRGATGLSLVVAVLLAAVAAVLGKVWAPGAIASGVGAAMATLAVVWTTRTSDRLAVRDAKLRSLSTAVRTIDRGRLPQVAELRDPIALGVHPAPIGKGGPADRCPAFVPRDIGDQLMAAVLRDRFVLLVGESTAGKSRAAYEAVMAVAPGFRLIEPLHREAAPVATALAADTPGSVLWLDDLERFLGSGGLTGAAMSNVLEAGEDRLIIATIRSQEHARFSGRPTVAFEGLDRETLRQGWDVLRLATRLDLPRQWSVTEMRRAQRSSDPRIAHALEHAARFGVGEYLAAGPQLLAEVREGWAPGGHPRGSALVHAAVDARRAGINRPLPPALLHQLHEPYLRQRGGALLRPESLDAALAWATAPLHATSSLLVPCDDGYVAFDYLVDTLDKERVPADALDALIDFATGHEAVDLGDLAWGWLLHDQARAAFQHASNAGIYKGTKRLYELISEGSGGEMAAARFAEQTASSLSAQLGEDHPDTLGTRMLAIKGVAFATDKRSGLQPLTELAERATRVLGAQHERTLLIWTYLAVLTGFSGDTHGAAAQFAHLADQYATVFGPDHELTVSRRIGRAWWTRQSGDPEDAARMLSTALDDATHRGTMSMAEIYSLRSLLASTLADAGDHPRALHQWAELITEMDRDHGASSWMSLRARTGRADCIGQAGDPGMAARLLDDLDAEVARMKASDSWLAFTIACERAWWTGMAGDPHTAIEQLTELLSRSMSSHDENAEPHVTDAQCQLAYWRATQNEPTGAVTQLEELIAHAAAALEPRAKVLLAAYRERERLRSLTT